MAIDMGSETVTLAMKERTWRVEIFCELGEDPTIRAHREIVRLDEDGKVIARDRDVPVVERRLSAIEAKSIAGVTGAQLAAMVAGVADALRQEDIVARSENAKLSDGSMRSDSAMLKP